MKPRQARLREDPRRELRQEMLSESVLDRVPGETQSRPFKVRVVQFSAPAQGNQQQVPTSEKPPHILKIKEGRTGWHMVPQLLKAP